MRDRRWNRGDNEVGCLIFLGVLSVGGYVGWLYVNDEQMRGKMLMGRECPYGAELVGAHPPLGTLEYCQRRDERGSYVKYGRFRIREDTGKLMDSGWVDGHGTVHHGLPGP